MRITNWPRWAALGGVGGLVIGSPALAQTAATGSLSIVDSPQVAQESSHYNLNGTFETQYQTNVAGGDAAVAELRGLKEADVIFTPNLLIDAFKTLGRESAFLTGSVGYNFYDRNSILNRENINLNGGLNGQLGSCRATATGGYSRRQDELEDVTRTKIQDVFDQTSVGLEGACGRQIGFSPTFSITQTWANNSLSELQSSNYNTLGGSGGITYQAPTFGSLSFFGQYQTTDFIDRILFFDASPEHDGFNTYGGGVRYVRQLGARIQGTVSLSYTSVKPFVGSSGFDGPTYSADLSFRASSRLSLHGSVIRDIQPSNVFDSDFFIETKGLIEATYNIGSRLKLNVGASQVDRSFKGPAIEPTLDLKSDTQKTVYATLTYTLKKMFFALNIHNDERTANLAGLSYPDTSVGLTAGTTF